MSQAPPFVLVLLSVAAAAGTARLHAQEPPQRPVAATSEREPRDERPRLPPPPPPPVDSSNTGYIDNAIVGTQLRLRYDSSTGADRPDRAEFIYGKCRCFTAFGQDGPSPGPTRNLDSQELALIYEHAFGERFSLFLEVPFRTVDITFPPGFDVLYMTPGERHSGLGDVRPGFKYALVARPDRYLTLQLKGYLATGEAAEGLGTNHDSIEPGLLYLHRSRGRYALAVEFRWWHPLGGSSDPLTGASDLTSPVGRVSANLTVDPPVLLGSPGLDPVVENDDFTGDVIRFGLGLSRAATPARVQVVPVAELVGWLIRSSFATPDEPFPPPEGRAFIEQAGGDLILNLKLGARIRRIGRGSLYVGYGIPLTQDDWYDGVLRFEYRLPLATSGRGATLAGTGQATRRLTTGETETEAAAPARPPNELAGSVDAIASPEREMPPPPTGRQLAQPQQPSVSVPAASAVAQKPESARAPVATPGEDVPAAVSRWSEAWSAQRVETYLASYSSRFRPAQGMSRSAWQAQRRERISAPSFIRVTLDEITVTLQGPVQATVELTQRYESNTYRDTVKKRLVMVLEGDVWKILREESSPSQ